MVCLVCDCGFAAIFFPRSALEITLGFRLFRGLTFKLACFISLVDIRLFDFFTAVFHLMRSLNDSVV